MKHIFEATVCRVATTFRPVGICKHSSLHDMTIIIFFLVSFSVPKVQAGEAELARVRSELPAAARRLDLIFSEVRGTARLWNESSHVVQKQPVTEARFAIDHGMEKVELTRITPDAEKRKLGEIVYCIGEATAFQLVRPAGAESFQVKGIGTTPRDRDRYFTLFGRFLHAHHDVLGYRLSTVLESPELELMEAETIEAAGKKLMKVDFATRSKSPRRGVSIVLDPDAGWTVQSCQMYELGSEAHIIMTVEVDYESPQGGVPLPKRVKIAEPGGVARYCEFAEWDFSTTPLTEFNMVHYGLPDLANAPRRRETLGYWLAGSAVVVAILAIGLWRAASHGRNSVPD